MEFKTIDQLKPGDPVYELYENDEGDFNVTKLILVEHDDFPRAFEDTYALSPESMKAGRTFKCDRIREDDWFINLDFGNFKRAKFSDIEGLKAILRCKGSDGNLILKYLDRIDEFDGRLEGWKLRNLRPDKTEDEKIFEIFNQNLFRK
jgi:hypothetical protein